MLRQHEAAEVEARELAKTLWRRDPERAKHVAAEASAHQRHLVRLRSSADDGTHGWVEACPKAPELSFNDAEFEYACRWRLGLAVMKQGQCQLCS